METLYQNSNRLIDATSSKNFRYLYQEIDWEGRLIGITGSRGTGKTTMMLQYIKANFPDRNKALYISLDNIWFSKNSLWDLANQFYAYGGTHLFIDEVHRYPTWSIEIKNIYDSFPTLYIVFTGSSILEIYKSNADLSRRTISYHLCGLSFREFLNFEGSYKFPVFSLDNIVSNHVQIATDIISKTKILPLYRKYLEYGYYPFYNEGIKSYSMRLLNVVNTILDNDLPSVEKIEFQSIIKLKKLLMIIASLVPFTPNMVKLSADIETNRASAIKYLEFLQRAGLIRLLVTSQKGISAMNKPEKILLDNSNLLYSLAGSNKNEGNVRETFFVNQLVVKHKVNTSKSGDFEVDNRYIVEVGGKNKSYNQIKDMTNSFIAMDDIETGYGNKIPLWLFGFLY